MTRRGILLIVAVAVAITTAAVYWFGPQHLFLDTRVDEALPTAATADGQTADAEKIEGPTVLSMGEFRSLAHGTRGVASILELKDGSRFLRIERLETSSGPDVRVYLSEAPADADADAHDDAFLDLGGLKGNHGDQNYEIPRGVDLDDYESVTIWCRRFAVGFGVAPLEAAR